MRIGMILDASFPPDPRVEKEALSLLQEGHEVYLFNLDFKHRSGVSEYKGIQLVRYPVGSIVYKLSALSYTFPFYRWKVKPLLEHFIRTYHIEALHVHDMVIAEAVFHANTSFKLPVVLDYHENRPEIMRQYKHVNSLSGKLLIDLRKWTRKYYELASQAQYVVVVTEAAKRDIVEKTKKDAVDIVAVPNSVDPEEFLKHPIQQAIVDRMKGSFNLLYIGDTSIRRGVDTAIESVALLKKDIPNIKLWLVGKGSADSELKAQSKRLNIVDHIEFEGWQDPVTFPSYLQGAHIAISPLKRNLHHDTTYANKLFQYMVCGKPLVVSDSIAQADLVKAEQCGLVFKADEPNDFADKILYLFSHPEEAAEMGSSGRNAVHNTWNWDMAIKPLLKLYEGLLG